MNDDAIIELLNSQTRREILKHIVENGEPMRPGQVAKEIGNGSDNVSYHFHVLKAAGALVVADESTSGSKQRYYFPDRTVIDTGWVREVLGLPPVDTEER